MKKTNHHHNQQNVAQTTCLFPCLFFMVLLLLLLNGVNGADDKLSQKCNQVVQSVIPCLNFATGKSEAPSKECCDAVAKIKESDPECLCYIIQQTHDGNPQSKSLGIQEAKLLQLPSVCNVKNANISECPKLLGLPPNSPDAAIFKNASKVTPPTPSSTRPSPSTPHQCQNDSHGTTVTPSMITELMTVALAIFLVAILVEFVSIDT